MKKKKAYYIYSFFICVLSIINIIINISPLKYAIYVYNVVRRDYDIGLYIYGIVMAISLVIIILNIIGMWLYKKDKKVKISIVISIFSIIFLLFIFIQAIYFINSTINLLNQYEGSTASHLYVHYLQLAFSAICIILEIFKLVIISKFARKPKENAVKPDEVK